MMIGMATVIPSTIIGIVGGILIAAILAMWEKRVGSVLAGLIGLTVGIILMLIVNYVIWQNSSIGFSARTPFLDFLIHQNLFFVPSVIAILLSTIGTLQINRKEPLELSTG